MHDSHALFRSFFQRFLLRLGIALALLVALSPGIAKADVFGMSLGYRKHDIISVDLLFPLQRHGQKRPKGGVLHIGVDFGVESVRKAIIYDYTYFNFYIPIAYQYVFKSGIGVLVGGEVGYFKTQIGTTEIDGGGDAIFSGNLRGGVVIGGQYFFKNGVFLSFKFAAGGGGGNGKTTYERPSTGNNSNASFAYVAQTLAIGYMF